MAKHYIRLDKNNLVIYGFSDAFEQPQTGDICVNIDDERQFKLFGNINPSLLNDNGKPLYSYINNTVTQRSSSDLLPTLNEAQIAKIVSLKSSFQQTLDSGFTSSASGTALTYGFEDVDQTNISQELNIVNAGLETFPITWGLKGGASTVSLTQAQFLQVCKDSKDFKWAHVNKLRNLIGQVQLATTLVTVNAIVW